jgi:dihydrofolate reductase
MYSIRPNLVFGFHGCDAKTCQGLLNTPNEIVYSRKPYDWLGHGMYFWENNYDRALQWAKDKKARGDIKTPAVIGAVLYLGYCLDLLDNQFVKIIQGYYKPLESEYRNSNIELPQNRDLSQDKYKDKIFRELDCTLIEYMHQSILEQINEDKETTGYSELKLFDSARGVFTEGGPAYPGAGILEKSHIQIFIRNSNCIKGFFLPRKEKEFSSESLIREQKKQFKK